MMRQAENLVHSDPTVSGFCYLRNGNYLDVYTGKVNGKFYPRIGHEGPEGE